MSSLVLSLIKSRKKNIEGLVSSTSVDGVDIYSASIGSGMKTPMTLNIGSKDDMYLASLDAAMKTPMLSNNIAISDDTDIYSVSH